MKGFDIDVFVNDPKGKFSEDAALNFKRLREISGFQCEPSARLNNIVLMIKQLLLMLFSEPDYQDP